MRDPRVPQDTPCYGSRVLASSAEFHVGELVWDPVHHVEGGETGTPEAGVIFVLEGVVQRTARSATARLDANRASLVNRDDVHRHRHPRGRVRALAVGLRPDLAEELYALSGRDPRFDPANPFRDLSFPLDSRIHALAVAATEHAAGATPDPLLLEEAWYRMVASLAPSLGPAPAARRVAGRSAARFHSAWAFLHESIDREVRLRDVARVAGCSVWHLTDVFREHSGMPVYRYLRRLRLRAALLRMRDDAENLADVALETGFSTHSHFTSAFRAEFGITPGRWRDATTEGRLRNAIDHLP